MAFESTPERLAIRDRLVTAFVESSIGQVVSHDTIRRVIGARTSSPNAIKNSAFRLCEQEHGIAFENVRGVGYRRLRPAELQRVGAATRHSIRGKAKRGTRKIEAVLSANHNSMTGGDKKAAYVELALLGMVRMAAGHATARRAHAGEAAANQNKPAKPGDIAKAVLAELSQRAS